MDVNGDGIRDLDPSRISYFGQSLGGMYGTVFLAVEPDVHAGVPVVPGGSYIDIGRLGPTFRRAAGPLLDQRDPKSLLNSPGVTALGDTQDNLYPVTPVPGPNPDFFDEDMPLRDGVPMTVRLADGTIRKIQSPVTVPVAGAMAIQQVIENAEWVTQSSNPVAYAPHLRKDPLPGVSPKAVRFQFARGDQSIPNPLNTALIRAGDLAGRTTFYRHDLAYAENPALPPDPHGFLTASTTSTTGGQLVFGDIARGAQEQIATYFEEFFRTGQEFIIHPTPARFFETTIAEPLPEALNFVSRPSALAGAQALIPGSPTSGSIATNATSNTLEGGLLGWPPATTDAPAGSPLWAPVMATSGSTGAAWTVPLAVPSALPISPPIDLALDALPPLGWLDSSLDDLAAGLLRPARRRH
jgi:hypothetical protein